MHRPTYKDISHVLVYFNVNAYSPEELPKDFAKMPELDRNKARSDMLELLKEGGLSAADFYSATACSARNEETAQKFFRDVFAYAFEGGEEPDVSDYI